MILRSERAGTLYYVQPFSDTPVAVMAPATGRAVVIDAPAPVGAAAAPYRITAWSAAGDTLWATERSSAPVAIPRAVRDSIRGRFVTHYGARFGADQIDRELFLPEYRPPVREAVASYDGTVWVREVTPTGARYVVLSAQGVAIGRIEVGRSVVLKWVGGDEAWGVATDADDLPRLIRYRIQRTAR